jgi:hypothetical protein
MKFNYPFKEARQMSEVEKTVREQIEKAFKNGMHSLR